MKLNLVLVAATGALAIANPAKRQSRFKWFGVSESVAEFGESHLPGVLGTDYYWPNLDAVDLLIADGMNLFRIPFRIERLSPDTVDGEFAPKYLEDLIATVTHITGKGAFAAIDPHNYGRYYDNILVPAEFKTFWANVATHFAGNDHVIFDTNNEFHDIDQEVVLQLNQAAIDGIRSVGAKSQYIFAEGNAWTGAWTWVDNNDDMKTLTDPENKIIFEMHQYFNTDGSGSQTCVSPTIGQERVVSATEWLRKNNKLGFIGEYSGYPDDVCKAAVANMLKYLADNSDVWTGASWWAAGPWWGDSVYSYEPPTGGAYLGYKQILQPYMPGGGNPQTSTTTKPPTTSTTTKPPTTTTSKPHTSTTSKPPASTTSNPPGGGSTSPHWGQCGGQGWTGPTTCVAGTTCKFSNPWYSQCL